MAEATRRREQAWNGSRRPTDSYLPTTATLSMGMWNCRGFSKTKKDILSQCDFDLTCITETHEWRDTDPLTIYSEPPPKNDSWSGVAITVNKRISNAIMDSNSIGSRIVYCRIRGQSCNITAVAVYIPQKQRQNPAQTDTYDQLEKFPMTVGRRISIILLGD